MKIFSLQKFSVLLCTWLITLSCTHSGYEDVIDNGKWRLLDDEEREGWYLRVNNKIYGCDEIDIKCCIKYYSPLKGIHINTFKVAKDCDYAKDKNHVYYPLHVRCEDSIEESEDGCGDACYFIEYVIKDADPKTFKYLGDEYAVDKRHMYYQGIQIPWDNDILDEVKRQEKKKTQRLPGAPSHTDLLDTIPY